MKALLATMLLPMILGAQTPERSTWTVTTVAGPLSWPGHKVKISFAADRVSFIDPREKRQIDIRGDEITQAAYSTVRFSRTQQLGGKYDSSSWSMGNMSGCGAPGCGGVLLVALIAAAVAAPMHGTSHFIVLTWVDRDVEQQFQFEVAKSDVEGLTGRLRELAGVHWADVDEQREAAEKAIQEQGSQATLIEFERDSWCGTFVLPKGMYRVLVVQNNQGATAYLFADAVEITRLRAILPAHIGGDASTAAVQYAPESARIASIRWHDKWLEFPGGGSLPQPGSKDPVSALTLQR